MPKQISNRKKSNSKTEPLSRAVTVPSLTAPASDEPASSAETEKELARREARERAAAHRARTAEENAQAAAERAAASPRNPLLDLSEERRSKLFAWLRNCPYDDAVREMLRGEGIPGVTKLQLEEFFRREAEDHWEKRIERAATEANALVDLVERNPVRFSSGILAALGQEAFRQIASGEVAPEAMNKMATLFLRARADERADQMGTLKREKLRQEVIGRVNVALEKFSEEVNRHPASRAIFEQLQRELRDTMEGEE